MPMIRSETGSVTFEFVFMATFLSMTVWIAGELFQLFRSSIIAREIVENSVDQSLQSAGWPVCLEDLFETSIRNTITIQNKYTAAAATTLYVHPLCRQE